jgi:hypothetical protein
MDEAAFQPPPKLLDAVMADTRATGFQNWCWPPVGALLRVMAALKTVLRVGPEASHRARREKIEISTGSVTRMTSGASIMPVTTTTAKGFCTCDPIPADIAAGISPTPATTQVISTGRS